jgi:DNA-directed RNA polymerase specialized sigma24 family protein
MIIYQIKNTSRLKKWQIGVLELSTFSFTQPKKKEGRKPKKLKVKNARKGIDLTKKHLEVKKLFRKHCLNLCYINNCDPEDVLQEVYKGILIRNKGKCPYDEKKSAFSTYVVMVSRCVTINYINKARKRAQREIFGKEKSAEDVYTLNIPKDVVEGEINERILLSELRGLLKEELVDIYDDLLDGHKISHISRRRKMDTRKVNKYIKDIRKTLEPYTKGSRC